MSPAVVFPGGKINSEQEHRRAPIVFVVDGDGLARESLQRLIGCEGWRCEVFASPQELLALPPAVVPNCLILDTSLEGLNAIDLQSRLAIDRPITPIIFITARTDLFTAVKAMKAGAIEFLTKPLSPDALLTSIREALERSCVLLAHKAEMQVLRDRYSLLTARERQVMALVVSGLLNKTGRWRAWHKRDHGEGPPRASDAKNGC